MPTAPTPVILIDEIGEIELHADKVVLTFGSFGSEVRVCLSRHMLRKFGEKAIRMLNALDREAQLTAEIMNLPQRGRR